MEEKKERERGNGDDGEVSGKAWQISLLGNGHVIECMFDGFIL